MKYKIYEELFSLMSRLMCGLIYSLLHVAVEFYNSSISKQSSSSIHKALPKFLTTRLNFSKTLQGDIIYCAFNTIRF